MTFSQILATGKKPVIMQVLPALNTGGVEQGVVDLNAEIVKAGAKSIVISSGGTRVNEIANAGGMHITLPVHSKNPLVIFANIKKIKDVIQRHNVDIVHACSRAPAWSAYHAVKGTTARFVTSCHSAHKVSGAVKRLYNSSIVSGERVIAASEYLADYLRNNYKFDFSKLRMVHRGISLDKFNPDAVFPPQVEAARKAFQIPDGHKVLVLPARLTRSKGHQFTLEALKKLDRSDYVCVFLTSNTGTQSFKSELEDDIRKSGLENRVKIGSYDMPTAYAMSDVVLSPTIIPEGFGRVPVEAQAMGIPVITTNHGGVRETVKHGRTGWLVSPTDSTEFSAAIRDALSLTPEKRRSFAKEARENVVNNFTAQRMGMMTLDVYAELMDGAKAQHSTRFAA